jgi:hypothetical protein
VKNESESLSRESLRTDLLPNGLAAPLLCERQSNGWRPLSLTSSEGCPTHDNERLCNSQVIKGTAVNHKLAFLCPPSQKAKCLIVHALFFRVTSKGVKPASHSRARKLENRTVHSKMFTYHYRGGACGSCRALLCR